MWIPPKHHRGLGAVQGYRGETDIQRENVQSNCSNHIQRWFKDTWPVKLWHSLSKNVSFTALRSCSVHYVSASACIVCQSRPRQWFPLILLNNLKCWMWWWSQQRREQLLHIFTVSVNCQVQRPVCLPGGPHDHMLCIVVILSADPGHKRSPETKFKLDT